MPETQQPPLPWLRPHEAFPNPASAWGDDSPAPGLLAAGGVLDVTTLQNAYSQGIFPWYSQGDPILWWSTHPRMVLRPENFRLHTSLRKTLTAFIAHPDASIRINTAFNAVMRACAAPRQANIRTNTAHAPTNAPAGENASHAGTWISDDIIRAYTALHHAGEAHSVETWLNGQLAGGLYCVALGRAVYGESMFTRVPNASKIALAALIALCRHHGVEMIDCQQETAHLASLGATPIPRQTFIASIQRTQQQPAMHWAFTSALWQHLLPTPKN